MTVISGRTPEDRAAQVAAAGGTAKDAAVVEELAQFLAAASAPAPGPCLLCDEPVLPGENAPGRWYDLTGQRRAVHHWCALRNVLGGIGHLTDHQLWCVERGDPDMGLSYSESARQVAEWVARNGVPR